MKNGHREEKNHGMFGSKYIVRRACSGVSEAQASSRKVKHFLHVFHFKQLSSFVWTSLGSR
jgi:hypothetical protein